MATIDFLRLPGGVQILILVMLWPAIWAAVLMIVALTGDRLRRIRPGTALAPARDVPSRG
jgi:hypothetical protein